MISQKKPVICININSALQKFLVKIFNGDFGFCWVILTCNLANVRHTQTFHLEKTVVSYYILINIIISILTVHFDNEQHQYHRLNIKAKRHI